MKIKVNCQDGKNGNTPKGIKVKAIADYLGTTSESLIGKTDQNEKPSADGELDELDNEMLKLFSSLSDENKKAALDSLSFLTQQENRENEGGILLFRDTVGSICRN